MRKERDLFLLHIYPVPKDENEKEIQAGAERYEDEERAGMGRGSKWGKG